MTRRSKVWLTVASLFTAINLVGAGLAAAMREGIHAGSHVAFGLLGAYWMWRVVRPWLQADDASVQMAAGRLNQLQQSVDAVALEVERIGEAQRFATKVAAEGVKPDAGKRL